MKRITHICDICKGIIEEDGDPARDAHFREKLRDYPRLEVTVAVQLRVGINTSEIKPADYCNACREEFYNAIVNIVENRKGVHHENSKAEKHGSTE